MQANKDNAAIFAIFSFEKTGCFRKNKITQAVSTATHAAYE